MAGPNVELFKFGLYLFFPLAIMIHVGDPEWYERHVRPIRDSFWPSPDTLYVPPRDQASIRSELERLRAERREKARRAIEEGKNSRSSAASPLSAASASSTPLSPSPTASPAAVAAAAAAQRSATTPAAASTSSRLGSLMREAQLRHGLTPPAGVARHDERETQAQREARCETWAAIGRGRSV